MQNHLSTFLAYTLILIVFSFAHNESKAAEPKQTVPLWKALKSGTAFALIRHALAPGIGDPENFVLGKCHTQRNLSFKGRQQAARIGKRFRAHGIRQARVFTSEWCRCRETAELLMIGKVEPLQEINSFFETPDKAVSQTYTFKLWLNAYRGSRPLVLVTHQVNITALTGIFPRSGEVVVVQRQSDGGFYVMGSL